MALPQPSSHELDHGHNPGFPAVLNAIYESLRSNNQARSTTLVTRDGLSFLCVPQSTTVQSTALRAAVGSIFGFADAELFSIVQVVGDSSTSFSQNGLCTAHELLSKLIAPNTVIEYGYTASAYDANWLVNDFIASKPECAARTVANLVTESSAAVQEWGCEATSLVTKFTLCYNSDGRKTKFGDDTWISDGIMSGESGDKMLCIEGGVQAFEQCVNVLHKGVEVLAATGAGVRLVQKSASAKSGKFSAAQLLRVLVEQYSVEGISSLEAVGKQYIDTCQPQSLSNEKRITVEQNLKRLKPELLDSVKPCIIE